MRAELHALSRITSLVAAAIFGVGSSARAASPVPAFDVAYRAWDAVTDIAKYNGDPTISGECGKTFRPFVIPGLKMQGRQDQEVAAAACYATARAACTNARLKRTAELAQKCGEFR